MILYNLPTIVSQYFEQRCIFQMCTRINLMLGMSEVVRHFHQEIQNAVDLKTMESVITDKSDMDSGE